MPYHAPDLTGEHFRAVIEHLGEGMIVAQDERVVYANARAAEIAGMSLDEMRDAGLMTRVHPDDQDFVLERYRKRMAGETVESRYEVRLLLPDGSVRWLSISATTVPWNGKSAAMTFFTDISEKKMLEATLRQTLEQRETILENSLVGIAFLSEQNEFLWANRSMGRIFGMTGGMLWPSDWQTLFVNDADRERVLADVARCMQDGRVYLAEMQFRKVTGEIFWVSLSGKKVSNTDARQGTVWVVADISERVALEAALKRSMIEREAILNSAGVGMCLNIERRVQWANDKFLEVSGYSRDQLTGQSTRMFFPSEESFVADGIATNLALARGETYATELELMRPSGECYWVQLTGRRLNAADPQAGDIWTVLDITQRRRLEDKTRAALERQFELNTLRSRFLAMTSHEFRTPLAVILSSAELLKRYSDRMDEAERSDVLGSIEAGVQRMIDMLDRVQLVGNTDAQLLVFAPKPLALAPLCKAIVAETQALLGHARCTVNLSLQDPQANGVFDANLLRHMFGNLLANAIKYSPEGSEVGFNVTAVDGRTVFEVSDRGIGIPQVELNHLFESFHRASNVGNIPGTGLGLAIVKKAVELHGGNIAVKSELGEGSVFTVTL